MSKQWLTKNLDFEVKNVDEAGAFEGYAAVFNNVDFDGDKIIKGAFKRTIDHKSGKFPVLWQHRIDQPVGVNVEAKEDEYGLFVKGVLELTSNEGKRAHAWMKLAMEKGLKVGLSIGYRVIKSAQDTANKAVRLLKEIELFEYSIVTFPANELANVTDAKNKGDGMTLDKLLGEAKALDFNQAFQHALNEQQLYNLKWTIMDALGESLGSTMEDETLTLDEKKANIAIIFDQYGKAMTQLYSKFLDLEAATEGDEGDKNANGETEVKVGNKIGKETRQAIMDACDMHEKACDQHKAGISCHKKAVKTLRRLCGGSKSEDKPDTPPPTPAPENNDSALKELYSSISSLHQKIVAK